MEPAANKSRKSEIEALVHLSKAIITDPKKVNAIVDILAKLEVRNSNFVLDHVVCTTIMDHDGYRSKGFPLHRCEHLLPVGFLG